MYEGRRKSVKVMALRVGDVVEFYHHVDRTLPGLRAVVEDVLFFDSFRDALAALPIANVLEEGTGIDEGVEIYRRYVSEETQAREGVAMIRIALAATGLGQ